MTAHVSQLSFAHVSPQLKASNAPSPKQMQVDTTFSPPTAVEIAQVYVAVQKQLEGGLAAPSAPRTASACSPCGVETHLAYTNHPHESHLKACNGRKW